MMTFKKALVVPAVAAMTLIGFVSADVSAFAQTASGTDSSFIGKRYNRRALTVRRRAPAPVVAVTPAPAPVAGPITGPLSTVVGLPFQALGSVFPAPGPRAGGPTAVKYVGAGAVAASIDEGFAQPVPVDKSGPIYVVQNGDPTVSPLSIIGAPIAVAGQIAQTPFKIIAATGL